MADPKAGSPSWSDRGEYVTHPAMVNMFEPGVVTFTVPADKYHELQAKYDRALDRIHQLQEAVLHHNMLALERADMDAFVKIPATNPTNNGRD